MTGTSPTDCGFFYATDKEMLHNLWPRSHLSCLKAQLLLGAGVTDWLVSHFQPIIVFSELCTSSYLA